MTNSCVVLTCRRRFQFWTALEAILALVFTNCFWVGLWDLLNNTVFPIDRSADMYSLVRAETPQDQSTFILSGNRGISLLRRRAHV